MEVDIWHRLIDLEHKAADFGLTWPNAITIMQQIESECREIREQLNETNQDSVLLSAEIGDLMHAVMSLSWFCGFDSHDVLKQSCDKFDTRLQMMKTIAKEQGLEHMKDKSFSELIEYWQLSKSRLDQM
ncbi:MAG: hypothetical protein QG556_640 [Pseudomonadota bacterium]|nr:hypothetical protein [Pseudomonadota bacterium]